MDNRMETLGSYLRRERELREITMEEIARETRIRQNLLEAIEEDDFDILPAPVFVKGFLRTYSKYVGLDGNDVVLRYEALLERLKEGNKKDNNVEGEDERTTLPAYRLILLIPLLVFIFLMIYIFWTVYR